MVRIELLFRPHSIKLLILRNRLLNNCIKQRHLMVSRVSLRCFHLFLYYEYYNTLSIKTFRKILILEKSSDRLLKPYQGFQDWTKRNRLFFGLRFRFALRIQSIGQTIFYIELRRFQQKEKG